MARHPDTDVLAEFREGLIGRRRSARIRAHLSGCSRCASLESGLAEVTTLLASAPAPRMPDELTARLESVLTAEVAARAQAESTGTARKSTGTPRKSTGTARESTGTPGEADRRRGGWYRPARSAGRPGQWRTAVLGVAAVIAVIFAIGGSYGLARLVHSGSGVSSALSSGRAEGSHGAVPTPPYEPQREGGPAAAQQLAGHVPVIHSGTDYLPDRLRAQAETMLAAHRASVTPQAQAAPLASGQLAALQGCVTLITGGARPLLVDVASYQGRQATVIVQAPAGRQPGQVWVVGPGCSADHRDLVAHTQLTGTG
jgi:hypothetical protein